MHKYLYEKHISTAINFFRVFLLFCQAIIFSPRQIPSSEDERFFFEYHLASESLEPKEQDLKVKTRAIS